jgi:hypothetical protein
MSMEPAAPDGQVVERRTLVCLIPLPDGTKLVLVLQPVIVM